MEGYRAGTCQRVRTGRRATAIPLGEPMALRLLYKHQHVFPLLSGIQYYIQITVSEYVYGDRLTVDPFFVKVNMWSLP